MSKFSKKDFYFSIVTGLITGFAVWRIFEYLKIQPLTIGIGKSYTICPFLPPCFEAYPFYLYVPWIFLTVIIPILWILGVKLGYFLGRWFGFFNQFGKFAAIGFTNGAVDFVVLNLLIANTEISSGGWYSIFKAISFVSAVVPSYFWNKHWAFESNQGATLISSGGGFKFAKFMSVAVVSIFINTGIASLVVNYLHPLEGLSVQVWANVGAVAGSAVALIFSFVGFKMAVFKK